MAMIKLVSKYLTLLSLILTYSVMFYGQDNSKSCMDCHSGIIKYEVVHPVVEDACDNCHQSTGGKHPDANGKEFSLNAEGPDLCYMCHDSKNTKTNVHSPITDGYCWMCHSPHASPNAALLTKNPTEQVCKMCHDLEIPKTDYIHAPVKEGNCQKCHDPHESDNSSYLKDKKAQLCFNCHPNVLKEKELASQHYPFSDDCSTCHKSHSSSDKYLMTEKTPGLCFNCHDDFTELSKTMKSSHSVLFNDRNCANCHSPHASSYNSMLKKESKDVCLSCHTKSFKKDNKSIDGIGQKINTAKSVHAAIEMDGCATCHMSHFSEYNGLLKGAYPDGNYTESKVENFALCFECHDRELLEKKNTIGATNFRTADLNMHFLHINGKKGRTCHLCHDMHASGNEHLILEKRMFGNWEMTMNYKITKTGGTCFPGCHGEKSYER